ncbi:molybdenum cofactor guanylyltransferase [Mycolicibacterium rhodesiae]|uniref:Probable molybdenum cofactor guanylyltransferase n=1 Tax=Mycolicibacterium rhodesiae TaxID=36814 RepID=A0A1X0IUC8_MYCRH|nr:molybdenum cofactor guanylyltransferase [Mycolicibacterium rhodesiae]MCV7346162.1 molybdenum cofactor guanylyltransferase [Mycolicibacterium rhodesiae]ORB52438.1 molybdenum cofactor guanylyltransferase [Mycolicibacterium rhodesiae]
MSTPAPLAAVVLAGGASRRMGRDKATLPHPDGGATMVEYTVATLSSRCAPVFVIAAPGQALPALDGQILRDEVRGVGPLLATGRGLRAAAEAGVERAFVSAVDMPYLSTEIIDELARHRGVDIVLPWDGRDHYLAGIYNTALADHIDSLVAGGERSMRALAESVVTQRIVMPSSRALANVNSPADLAQQIAG